MVRAGIDIGGTFIKAGLVEENTGRIIVQSAIPFPLGNKEAEIWSSIALQTDELLQKSQMNRTDLLSIGVAVAGSIDPKAEMILHAYNLNFNNTPIKKSLEEIFPGIPILIINDANAATLAEHRFGALRGADTAVLITLGTGVGGGLILGGKLFNGGNGNGVELGHMTLKFDGTEHNCGNKGCFELYCSAGALTEDNCLWNDAEEVFNAVKIKNPLAQAKLESYIEALSSALVSITNLLDPEIIAVGGGISGAGETLFTPLRAKVKEKSFFNKDYRIVAASLGNSAGLVGAAIAFGYVSHNI